MFWFTYAHCAFTLKLNIQSLRTAARHQTIVWTNINQFSMMSVHECVIVQLYDVVHFRYIELCIIYQPCILFAETSLNTCWWGLLPRLIRYDLQCQKFSSGQILKLHIHSTSTRINENQVFVQNVNLWSDTSCYMATDKNRSGKGLSTAQNQAITWPNGNLLSVTKSTGD